MRHAILCWAIMGVTMGPLAVLDALTKSLVDAVQRIYKQAGYGQFASRARTVHDAMLSRITADMARQLELEGDRADRFRWTLRENSGVRGGDIELTRTHTMTGKSIGTVVCHIDHEGNARVIVDRGKYVRYDDNDHVVTLARDAVAFLEPIVQAQGVREIVVRGNRVGDTAALMNSGLYGWPPSAILQGKNHEIVNAAQREAGGQLGEDIFHLSPAQACGRHAAFFRDLEDYPSGKPDFEDNPRALWLRWLGPGGQA